MHSDPLHEVCDMSLLQQQSKVVTSAAESASDSEDELEVIVTESSPSGGGGSLAWRKMSQKIHPAYSVSAQTEEVGKVFKGTKVRHVWTVVLPEDAVETGVLLPLDARTTKLELVHSTMSGRIEIILNDELSFASMMRGDSAWKLAKKSDLSPILFDAQLYFKKHTVRVTIKNASEKQFKVRLHDFVFRMTVWALVKFVHCVSLATHGG